LPRYALVERCEHFDLIFKDLNGDKVQVNVPAQIFSTTNRNFVNNPINKEMMRRSVYQRVTKSVVHYIFFDGLLSVRAAGCLIDLLGFLFNLFGFCSCFRQHFLIDFLIIGHLVF
jgi:hypothetical protein